MDKILKGRKYLWNKNILLDKTGFFDKKKWTKSLGST